MAFIEKVGQKRVGFCCWKLFAINYYRCYEVIIFFQNSLKSKKPYKQK
jgi:hypothetical protein